MTFNAAVPLATDSPSNFPAQNQTNMARLQTIISANHVFNLTAAANDGFHNVICMTQQAPSGPLAATGRLFAKTSGSFVQVFYMDDAGREYQVTPGIIAAVNFQANGAIRTPGVVNVSSVTRTGTGLYTINFTTPIATANYIVSVTGMKDTSGEVIGFVQGGGTYSASVTQSFLKVGFENRSGTPHDVTMGNVIVYSVV